MLEQSASATQAEKSRTGSDSSSAPAFVLENWTLPAAVFAVVDDDEKLERPERAAIGRVLGEGAQAANSCFERAVAFAGLMDGESSVVMLVWRVSVAVEIGGEVL